MERAELSAPTAVAIRAAMLRLEVERRGELWIRAEGGSMWPTIHAGDDVLLAPARATPHRGDIVLVDTGARLLLHRVRRVGARRLTTAGDAGTADEAELDLGKVVALASASRRGAHLTPLTPTLRFGLRGLARWALLRARLLVARAWRRMRPTRAPRFHILTPP